MSARLPFRNVRPWFWRSRRASWRRTDFRKAADYGFRCLLCSRSSFTYCPAQSVRASRIFAVMDYEDAAELGVGTGVSWVRMAEGRTIVVAGRGRGVQSTAPPRILLRYLPHDGWHSSTVESCQATQVRLPSNGKPTSPRSKSAQEGRFIVSKKPEAARLEDETGCRPLRFRPSRTAPIGNRWFVRTGTRSFQASH